MSFHNERSVKGIRKAARCDGCSQAIEIGQPAIRWAGLTDGYFGTLIYHPECRAAEIAFNKLCDSYGDEWERLFDIEWDDHAWLLAEFPIVAERRGITADTIREHEEERSYTRSARGTAALDAVVKTEV